MRILAGDTHMVMTVEDRDSAEGQYAKMRSNAKGLQERCDELASINREKTSRMEGITNANAALAAHVSDMRQEVITAQHGEDCAIRRTQLIEASEATIQESLKVSEQELQLTRQAGRDLEASYVTA